MSNPITWLATQKDGLEAAQSGIALFKTLYELYQWLTTGVSSVIHVRNWSTATIVFEGAGACKKSEAVFSDDVNILSISRSILKPGETGEITSKASNWWNAEIYVGISTLEVDKVFLQAICWDSSSKTYLAEKTMNKSEMKSYPKLTWTKDNKHGICKSFMITRIDGVKDARTLNTGAFTTI